MKSFLSLLATASIVGAGTLLGPVPASAQQTIKIGVPTSVQLQVGRGRGRGNELTVADISIRFPGVRCNDGHDRGIYQGCCYEEGNAQPSELAKMHKLTAPFFSEKRKLPA